MSSRVHARIGTIRQLEILLAVYDEGGVAVASEVLHLTQPTVSMQLKKLSEAIGMAIYQRVGRRLVFTERARRWWHRRGRSWPVSSGWICGWQTCVGCGQVSCESRL